MFFKLPKRFVSVVAVLLLLIIPLLFSSVVSGGRVIDIELFEDPTNQRLEISFTTNIEEIESLTMSPRTNFLYDFSNNVIEVKFLELLTYNTTYEVDIATVDTRGKASTQTIQFTTSNPEVFHLLRSSGEDQIFKSTIDGDSDVVFTSENIITYALGEKNIAAITEDPVSGVLSIQYGSNSADLSSDISRVRSFEGSQKTDEFLLVVQLEDSSHRSYKFADGNVQEILNPDVISARFAADNSSIIYQDAERNVFIIDGALQQPPVSIGNFGEIVQILANGSGFFVKQDATYTTIDANSGSSFVAPEAVQRAARAVSFNDQTGYFGVEPSYTNQTLNYDITFVENTGTSTVIDTLDDDVFVYDLLISPNNQYVLTSQSKAPVVFDNVDPHWQPQENPQTVVRDQEGTIVQTLDGSLVRWKL